MLEKLDDIQNEALKALENVKDDDSLQAWRVTHTGRSSALMQVFSGLGGLSKEERPQVGQKANQVKLALEAAFAERNQLVQETALMRSLESEQLDVCVHHQTPCGKRNQLQFCFPSQVPAHRVRFECHERPQPPQQIHQRHLRQRTSVHSARQELVSEDFSSTRSNLPEWICPLRHPSVKKTMHRDDNTPCKYPSPDRSRTPQKIYSLDRE